MMRIVLMLAAIVAALLAPALDNLVLAKDRPTIDQTHAIKHVAQAMMADLYCDDYGMDTTFTELLLQGIGLSGTDVGVGGRFNDLLMFEIGEAAKTLDKHPRPKACGAVVRLYGPNGENVRGLVKRK